jgi:type I restriction enzyme R subunit
VYEEPSNEVQLFWAAKMKKYATEANYNKQLISKFKFEDDPEIIIVVSKLLTGFDAPRNTVLYITKNLKSTICCRR